MTHAPLALESPRWQSLRAHFGNAGADGDLPAVPRLLKRWHAAVGTYGEEYEYTDLFESFLHQRTINDVAYAVVPHLVQRLEEVDADRRVELIDHVAIVDEVRRTTPRQLKAMIAEIERSVSEELRADFVQAARDRTPPLPDDLAPAYLEAVARAKKLAGKAWGKFLSEQDGPHQYRRHVRCLRERGVRDEDIEVAVRELALDRSPLGALVYQGADLARAGLRERAGVTLGERLRLSEPQERTFEALFALAWQHGRTPVSEMLRATSGR